MEQLLSHPTNRSQTGNRLETGTAFGLLQQDYSNMAILASDTWLQRIWPLLESIDAFITFDSPSFSLFREGERLLNEIFIDMVDQEDLR